MEYIYAAMLLHSAGQKIEEASIKRVLEASGVQVDETRVKALVASLEGVNIDEVIKQATIRAAPTPAEVKPEEKKEEKKEEEVEKKAEEATAGLGALFG